MPQVNLDAGIQPLLEWLTQQQTVIIIVIGNGPGANVASTQIDAMLTGAAGDYENVAFGTVADSATIEAALTASGMISCSPYALISISANPKKLVSTIKDAELIGNPGWVQQAIIEAEAAND